MVLGAQTYTVRAFTQSSADLRESLRRIARMGYTTVQLSAVGNMDARTLRDAADEAALKIVLTHIAEGRILQDTAAVIAEHEILGCDYIGLGAMSERYRRAEWIDRFWLDFERPAKMMRDAGKLFMYHNHNFEFGPLADGSRIIDRLMEIPSDLMGITLDTYWVQAAGCDVCDWIERLRGRIPCVHLKDMTCSGFETRMAAVGAGNMPFEKILRALSDGGGVKYALVEQDDCYGQSPFDCLKASYDYLRGLGLK